jgi:hypothetical protein
MLMRKTYASAVGGETGRIWIFSTPPRSARPTRAVPLVHPVRHRDEHLGRLVVAARQLDVVRLREGPAVELVDLSAETRTADPRDPADLGNDSLPDAVVEHLRSDALRSDIFEGLRPPFATEKVPLMTTDAFTLPGAPS